ncbi:hypothetical protein GUJ93_ZPchr0010g11046 [Zizania palustris]|uniref:Uncharacterized protein n=1 Tax=Zizania palustris TaxID=103762 RepID=A0A8J5TIH6_ZIZPA|nr:hypothetical protein GUJ93_ZPchr0010g11046 [Zizania palustris]
MQRPPMEGDPCPNCILDVVGMAFGVGDVGGSAFYFLNGLRNSSKGARLAGAGFETNASPNFPQWWGSSGRWEAPSGEQRGALLRARRRRAADGGVLCSKQGGSERREAPLSGGRRLRTMGLRSGCRGALHFGWWEDPLRVAGVCGR